MKPLEVGEFLVVHPRAGRSQLTFKGTRVAVATVLRQLARGQTVEAILATRPHLRREAIAEAVRQATEALLERHAEQMRAARASVGWGRPPEEAIDPMPVGKYLVIHPRVCFGKLTFDGTRVPVETVLLYLAKGEPIDRLLAGWPEVKRAAIEEAILLAAAALRERYAIPTEATDEPTRTGRSA